MIGSQERYDVLSDSDDEDITNMMARKPSSFFSSQNRNNSQNNSVGNMPPPPIPHRQQQHQQPQIQQQSNLSQNWSASKSKRRRLNAEISPPSPFESSSSSSSKPVFAASSTSKESRRRAERLRKEQEQEQEQDRRRNRPSSSSQNYFSSSQSVSQRNNRNQRNPAPRPLTEQNYSRNNNRDRRPPSMAKSRSGETAPSSSQRLMLIPGPVGAAVALQNGILPSTVATANSRRSKRRRNEFDTNTNNNNNRTATTNTPRKPADDSRFVFLQGPWLSACKMWGRVPPKCRDRSKLVDWVYNSDVNLYKIIDIASKKLVQLDYLLVLVDQINHRNGIIEIRVRDESGYATATLHDRAAESFSAQIVPGAVLLLQDVKVWRTKHPGRDNSAWLNYFLNITANNLKQIVDVNSVVPDSMLNYPRYDESSQVSERSTPPGEDGSRNSNSSSSSSSSSNSSNSSNSSSNGNRNRNSQSIMPNSPSVSQNMPLQPQEILPRPSSSAVPLVSSQTSSASFLFDDDDDDDDEALMAMAIDIPPAQVAPAVVPVVPQSVPVAPVVAPPTSKRNDLDRLDNSVLSGDDY
jgi:hypothetical protein